MIIGTQGALVPAAVREGRSSPSTRHRRAAVEHDAGLAPGGDHHAVGHRVRRPGVRRRRRRSRRPSPASCRATPAARSAAAWWRSTWTPAQILWKTSAGAAGFPGNAVWGSSPAIDAKRGQLYIATGNNYSVPPAVLACVAAAGGDPVARRRACRRQPLRLDHGPRPEDRAPSAGRRERCRFDAWTVELPPPLRRRLQLPRAGRARLRLRSGAGAVHGHGGKGRHATSSAPARRAASTGRSTPTPARSVGSPRPAPAGPPAVCSGARPSTASASTRRTPTATPCRGRCPTGHDHRRVERHSTPPPAQLLWQTTVADRAATPFAVGQPPAR